MAHSWEQDSKAPTQSPAIRKPASSAVSYSDPERRQPAPTRDASLAEIQRLNACFQRADCEFPKSSSQSYRFALSEALAVAIAEHHANYGPEKEIAQFGIRNPEPIVKVAALEMLAAIPPSLENLSSLENGLRNSRDPDLLAQAMKELGRYVGSSLEIEAQRIVEGFLSRGPSFSSPQNASLLRPFINEHSYEEFQEILRKLEPGAETRKFLASALEEYERKRKP